MAGDTIVYRSAVFSLLVQLVVGGITAGAFALPLPNKTYEEDLRIIFATELGSQVIEFAWYLIVVCRFKEILTWTRYIDWVISTPIMLVSTAFFFRHRQELPLLDILQDTRLYVILALNWLMLASGLAIEVEHSRVPRILGLAVGGGALVGSFTVLSLYVDASDSISLWLFVSVYVVWFLYGGAAVLGYREKNVSYNLLDIVSKNFYGVFLFFYALYSVD